MDLDWVDRPGGSRLLFQARKMCRWLAGAAPVGLVVAIVAGLFALDLLVSLAVPHNLTSTGVLILPVAIAALRFGTAGGAVTGVLAGATSLVGEGFGDIAVDVSRIATFVLVGALVGWFVDERSLVEQRLSRHHHVSQDLFSIATPDGRLHDMNPAWEWVLGFKRSEISKRQFIDLVHPDDRESTIRAFAKLTSGEESVTAFRNRYLRSDGRYVWLEWSARSERGRYVYSVSRDITLQREAEEALARERSLLERRVVERTFELERSRLETLRRLAAVAEYRDEGTFEHTERVGRNSSLLARELGLPTDAVALIRYAAPLHDIGKVGVPDSILLKPDLLDEEEIRIVRRHTDIGASMLRGSDFPVLQLGATIAHCHHESWDGTGYPRGLRGAEIPVVGRIVAVADAFDAMTHHRPYRETIAPADAFRELLACAGGQFDPDIVDAFLSLDPDTLVAPIADFDLRFSASLLLSQVPVELGLEPRHGAAVPDTAEKATRGQTAKSG